MVVVAGTARVTEKGRRRAIGLLLAGGAAMAVHWAAWLLDRSMLASDTRPAYYEHEGAFPLADAWLVFCLVAAARALAARRASALLWLLAAGGAGAFLVGTDVVYNLQHGIWISGQRGLVELFRNLATLAGTVAMLVWAWPRRAALLGGD
jgi:hypothetical protein